MPIYKDDMRPVERIMERVMVGDEFKTDGEKFVVTKVYKHYALCKRMRDGKLESFTLGDFVQLGMEDSMPSATNCLVIG
jgi:hypothetical protein